MTVQLLLVILCLFCVSDGLKTCPGVFNHQSYPPTNINTLAQGTCAKGYEGSPTRYCNGDGTWGPLNLNLCTRVVCADLEDEGTDWPSTFAGTTSYGVCKEGYHGSPRRKCQNDGTFGPITTAPCSVACDAVTFGNAYFAEGIPRSTVTGTCIPGYHQSSSGAPSRVCLENGQWRGYVRNRCERNYCPAIIEQNAFWAARPTGSIYYGKCAAGFVGRVKRTCNDDLTWSEIIGSCLPDEDDSGSNDDNSGSNDDNSGSNGSNNTGSGSNDDNSGSNGSNYSGSSGSNYSGSNGSNYSGSNGSNYGSGSNE